MARGGTTASTNNASFTFIVNRITAVPTNVTIWTIEVISPLWKNWFMASMSDVMRVITRPAISLS
jgi:hypothetical protein